MNIELDGVSLDLAFLPEEHQQAAADAITDAWQAGTTGLKSKNVGLIQQVKDLKEQAKIAGSDNNAELAIRLSETQEQLSQAKNDLQIAEHNATQSAKKLEAAESKAGEMSNKHDNLVKTTALTEQLNQVGVSDPHLLAASRAMLMADVSLGEDGTPIMNEMALSEALKTWAESDAGKSFVGAGGNSGGDADNNGKPGTHTGPNPWKAETRNYTEQSRILRESPELAKTLEAEAGSSGLAPPVVNTPQAAA